MNFRKIVEGTDAYKNLSLLMRSLTGKRQNINAIANHVHVANHLGREQWEKQTQCTQVNKAIVEEILDKQLVPPLEVKGPVILGIEGEIYRLTAS